MYLKWFLQERFVQPLGKTPLPRGSSLVRRLWKVGPDMLSQCSPFPRAPWKTQNVIFKYTSSPVWRGKDSVCTLFVCKIKCLSWLLLNGWLFVIDLLQFISNSLARSKHFPQLSFWSSFLSMRFLGDSWHDSSAWLLPETDRACPGCPSCCRLLSNEPVDRRCVSNSVPPK